jgi:hypothetical protein
MPTRVNGYVVAEVNADELLVTFRPPNPAPWSISDQTRNLERLLRVRFGWCGSRGIYRDYDGDGGWDATEQGWV